MIPSFLVSNLNFLCCSFSPSLFCFAQHGHDGDSYLHLEMTRNAGSESPFGSPGKGLQAAAFAVHVLQTDEHKEGPCRLILRL